MKLVNQPMTAVEQNVLGTGMESIDREKQPGTLSEVVAGIDRTSTWGDWFDRERWEKKLDQEAAYQRDPEYNPQQILSERPELLPYATDIIDLNSNVEFEDWDKKISVEQKRDEIMATGGAPAVFGTVIGTMGSPEFIPLLLANPLGSGGGVIKTGLRLAGLAATETAVHEATLQDTRITREILESGMNTAFAGLFGFGIGVGIGAVGKSIQGGYIKQLQDLKSEIINNNGIHKIVSAEELTALEILEAEKIAGQSRGSVNAAATKEFLSTREQEAPIWMPWIKSGQVAPIRQLWSAENPVVIRLMNKMWGHDLQIGYNSNPIYKTVDDITAPDYGAPILDEAGNKTQIGIEHIAKEVAVARIADRQIMTYVVSGQQIMIDNFMKMQGIEGKNFTLATTFKHREAYKQFNSDVRWATSHNDVAQKGIQNSEIIEATAKEFRQKVYDPILAEAKAAGLIEDDAVKYAESYMNRRWNRRAVYEKRGLFKQLGIEAFVDERAQLAMAARSGDLAERIRMRREAIALRPEELEGKLTKLTDDLGRREAELAESPITERMTEKEAGITSLRDEIDIYKGLLKGDGTTTRQLNEIEKRKTAIDKSIEDQKLVDAEYIERINKLTEHKKRLKAPYAVKRKAAEIKALREERQAAKKKHTVTRQKLAKERDTWKKRYADRKEKFREKRIALNKEKGKLERDLRRLNRSAPRVRKKGKILELEGKIKAINKKLLDDPTEARLTQEALDLESEMKRLRKEDFRNTEPDELQDIEQQVNDSYQKILTGELNPDYLPRGASAASLMTRKYPVSDTNLLNAGFLETDMMDQVRSYTNSMLRPAMLKKNNIDIDLKAEIQEIADSYDDLMRPYEDITLSSKATPDDIAAANKRIQELLDEKDLSIATHNLILDRFYGRPQVASGRYTDQISNIGAFMRNFNVMRMMGGVLFTSMADVARINLATAFAPGLGSLGPGYMAAMKTAKINREAYKAAGFAHEAASMVRLSRWMDIADPNQTAFITGKNAERILQGSTKGAQLLMKATLLAEWTDYMKLLAAASTQNQILFQVRNYAKLSPSAKSVLAEIGIDQRMVNVLTDEIGNKNINFINEYSADMGWDKWLNQVDAENMKDILFRQSERLLVTPRESDLPPLMDGNAGRLFLQFKSFSLAAHNQITLPMIQRMAHQGDMKAWSGVAQMMIAGVATEAIKLASQGREEELKDYTPMDYMLAAGDRSGAWAAIMMGFNQVDLMSGNMLTKSIGAMPASRYSDRSTLGFFGPSAGTVGDLFRMTAGWGDGIDEKDMRNAKRLLPFNNLGWTHRGSNNVMEWLTDDMEQVKRR